VYLDLGADDDAIAYVDGKQIQWFHWDDGHVLLTRSAHSGDHFLVAVQVTNGPGTGQLRHAQLSIAGAVSPQAAARDYEDSEAFTLWKESRLPARAAGLREKEARAAARIDTAGLATASPEAIEKELRSACADLADPEMRRLEDYLVGYAHTDIDWLWQWPETKDIWFHDDTTMARLMDEYPDFHFSQSQGVMYQTMKDEHPDLYAKIQAAVKRGQWEPLNGWCENDMNIPSGESEVRQAMLSNNFYEKEFGVTSPVCWRPDSFGHAWTLPMILKGCGVNDYYFCRAGKGIPIFWWQSPDGSRILAVQEQAWYNATISPATAQLTADQTARVGEPDWMTVYGVGDHGGGPTRDDINTATRLDALPAFPHMKFEKASAYFDRLRKEEPKKGYPVISDELNYVFQGCYTSHAESKFNNRRNEHALYSAEAWSSVGSLLGHPYPADTIQKAWYRVLVNQFHDIMAGSNIHPSYLYALNQDALALQGATTAQTGALQAIIQDIRTSGGQGTPLVVFNSLGWPRTEVVRAEIPGAPPASGALQARDSDGNTCIASAVAAGPNSTRVEFVARDVPAVGYRVYWLQPAQPVATALAAPGVIENEFYRVSYDPDRGVITGVYDKVHNREARRLGRFHAGPVGRRRQRLGPRPHSIDHSRSHGESARAHGKR
jgi:alpha-mannosidase